MASKKKAPSGVPNSITIPGGRATFYTRDELPIIRDRELRVLYAQLSPRRIRQIEHANKVTMEAEEKIAAAEKAGVEIDDLDALFKGPDVVLTEQEARLFLTGTDTVAWAYLKSWTLREANAITGESEPRPLPETPDDMLLLPRKVYEAITEHAAKLMAEDIAAGDQFGPDGVVDEASPTTASGA